MELLSQLGLSAADSGSHRAPPHGCRVWLVNYCIQETSEQYIRKAAGSFCRLVARIPFTHIYLPEEPEARLFLGPLLDMEPHLSTRVSFHESLRARAPDGPTDADAIRFVQSIEAEGLQALPEEPSLHSIVPRDSFWYNIDSDEGGEYAATTAPATPQSCTDSIPTTPYRPITTTTPRGQQQTTEHQSTIIQTQHNNNTPVSLQIRWTARTFVERVWNNSEFDHSQVLVLAGHSILYRMIPVFINRDMNNRLKPGGVTVITVCPVEIGQESIKRYADFLQVDSMLNGSHDYPRHQQRQTQPIAPFRDRPHNPRPFDNGTCSFFEVYNDRTYLDEDNYSYSNNH
eukprot:GHVS01023712.1.p1 GENE.GHVS01023712.1~~GHVS01023712.1.p1  ORF type:complete len:343 (+),score=33.45 GHVS01023712.1:270-1298(+)